MPFQSVPDTAEAVVNFIWGQQAVANVLNFVNPGGYGSAELQDLADVVDSWMASDYLTQMSTSIDYLFTLVRGLENLNDLEATANANTGVGDVGQVSVANNVAFVVTHRTGLTGRSARGRTYVPGMVASNLVDSTTWAGSLGVELVDEFTNLRLFTAAIGWSFCVVSRFSNGVLRATGVTFPITETVNRNNEVDSQRGRLSPGH